MTIAVLALQGAFAEHEKMIRSLGADCIELRQAEDLKKHYDGLILPGGESTVQGKLLRELGMFDTIKKQIEDGLPVLATCAGMILQPLLLMDKLPGSQIYILAHCLSASEEMLTEDNQQVFMQKQMSQAQVLSR